MIVENVRKVAARIRGIGGDDHFSMYDYLRHEQDGHACGTVGCIAGWAVMTLSESDAHSYLSGDVYTDIAVIAESLLGLEDYAAAALFAPRQPGIDQEGVTWSAVTPEIAATMLERIADLMERTGAGVLPADVYQFWSETPAWGKAA